MWLHFLNNLIDSLHQRDKRGDGINMVSLPRYAPAGAAAFCLEILFVRLISPSSHIHPMNIIAHS